ncbi:MAG: S-layer homology domain-containing protein [Actinomycetota bacterium]
MTTPKRIRSFASLMTLALFSSLLFFASTPATADGVANGSTLAGSITAGEGHTCALLSSGTVRCWGLNNKGQLGYGDMENRGDELGEMAALGPVDFGGTRTAQLLTTGDEYTCVLTATSTVKCWGDNDFGQLGLGTFRDIGDEVGEMGVNLDRVDLGTGRTAVSLVAGRDHTCAILDDDTLKCWGRNSSGQLGLGDDINRGGTPDEMGDFLAAVSLGAGRTAKAISLGDTHTCAILDDDSVKCWGEGELGQLGQGTKPDIGDGGGEMGDALMPISLGTGRTAAAISTGDSHSCAILDDGSVKCWGGNDVGQLGQGNKIQVGDDPGEMGNALAAVSLGTGRTAVAISTSANHNCVILDNGDLKCWGRNDKGQLGYGDSDDRGDGGGEMGDSLPAVDLGAGRTAEAVTTGTNHTCALLDDSTLRCWGNNDFGQLGIDSTEDVGDGDNNDADGDGDGDDDPGDTGPINTGDDTVGTPPAFQIPVCDASSKGFTDIGDSFAQSDINCLNDIGVIGGTTPTTYAPNDPISREAMAALMGRMWQSVLGGKCFADTHPFTDVSETSFAGKEIGCLVDLQVIGGKTPTTYAPGDSLTREEAAALIARLWRAFGGECTATTHPFTDVAETSFAKNDIACLTDLNIIGGTSPTTYAPGRALNRQEMAALLRRLYNEIRAL